MGIMKYEDVIVFNMNFILKVLAYISYFENKYTPHHYQLLSYNFILINKITS